MPVTFHPSTQPLASIGKHSTFVKDPLEFLQKSTSTSTLSKRIGEIFQSSYTNASPATQASGRFAATDLSQTLITPPRNVNGFVDAALTAYNQHHHLILRPDDVWLAILTQFNLYVNAHADDLRHLFVAHSDRKELVVTATGTRYTVDFGGMADAMGRQIQDHVLDPDLRQWLIPHFSTTTFNDRIVAAVVMMATLQSYFTYKFRLLCGLPAVTLLGTRDDWAQLRAKVETLPTYGAETAQWAALLRPVLSRFVAAFEKPHAEANTEFWRRIAHYEHEGSGTSILSGWITAFCFFDEKGRSLYAAGIGREEERRGRAAAVARMTAGEVAKVRARYGENASGFELDGVQFHKLDRKDVPPGYAYVKVKLDDNGAMFDTLMVAGLVGVRVEDSGVVGKGEGWESGQERLGKGYGEVEAKVEGHDGRRDTVRPEAGWWLFEDLEPDNEEEKEKV